MIATLWWDWLNGTLAVSLKRAKSSKRFMVRPVLLTESLLSGRHCMHKTLITPSVPPSPGSFYACILPDSFPENKRSGVKPNIGKSRLACAECWLLCPCTNGVGVAESWWEAMSPVFSHLVPWLFSLSTGGCALLTTSLPLRSNINIRGNKVLHLVQSRMPNVNLNRSLNV